MSETSFGNNFNTSITNENSGVAIGKGLQANGNEANHSDNQEAFTFNGEVSVEIIATRDPMGLILVSNNADALAGITIIKVTGKESLTIENLIKSEVSGTNIICGDKTYNNVGESTNFFLIIAQCLGDNDSEIPQPAIQIYRDYKSSINSLAPCIFVTQKDGRHIMNLTFSTDRTTTENSNPDIMGILKYLDNVITYHDQDSTIETQSAFQEQLGSASEHSSPELIGVAIDSLSDSGE